MFYSLVLANDYAAPTSTPAYNAPIQNAYAFRKYPIPAPIVNAPEPEKHQYVPEPEQEHHHLPEPEHWHHSEPEPEHHTPEPQAEHNSPEPVAEHQYTPEPLAEHNSPEPVSEHQYTPEPLPESAKPEPEATPVQSTGYQFKPVAESVQPESSSPEPSKISPEPAQESEPCEQQELAPSTYPGGNSYASPAKSTQYSDTYNGSASTASMVISFVSVHMLQ